MMTTDSDLTDLTSRLAGHYDDARRSMPIPASSPATAHRRARQRRRNSRLAGGLASVALLMAGGTAAYQLRPTGQQPTVAATDPDTSADSAATADSASNDPVGDVGYTEPALSWTALGETPFGQPAAVARTDSGYLAYGRNEDKYSLWSSPDGREWTFLGVPLGRIGASADGDSGRTLITPSQVGMWAEGQTVFLWTADHEDPVKVLESRDGGATFVPLDLPVEPYSPTSDLLTVQRWVSGLVQRSDGTLLVAVVQRPAIYGEDAARAAGRIDLAAELADGYSTTLTTDGVEVCPGTCTEPITISYDEMGLTGSDREFAATVVGVTDLLLRDPGSESFYRPGIASAFRVDSVGVIADADRAGTSPDNDNPAMSQFVVSGVKADPAAGASRVSVVSTDGPDWLDLDLPANTNEVLAGPNGSLLAIRTYQTPETTAGLGTMVSTDGGATWRDAGPMTPRPPAFHADPDGAMGLVWGSQTGVPLIITKDGYTVRYTESELKVIDATGKVVIQSSVFESTDQVVQEDPETGEQTFLDADGRKLFTISGTDITAAMEAQGFGSPDSSPYDFLVWSGNGRDWGLMSTGDAFDLDPSTIGGAQFSTTPDETLALISVGNDNTGADRSVLAFRTTTD